MINVLASVLLYQAQPNIIVIFSDDHARRAISTYGSKFTKTPGIDRIAREGIQFNRHYTANPLCAPSRAALLTGKHSHMNGHKDNTLSFNGAQSTLPKLLKAAGYETAMIGKWHLVSTPTGFDHWEVLPGQGNYYNPDFITPNGVQKNTGYVSQITTDKALKWLNQPRNKPFFLILGQKAPHRPWMPGPERLRDFENTIFPEPATLRTGYKGLASGTSLVHMSVEKDLRPQEDLMVNFTPKTLTPEQKLKWEAALKPQDAAYEARLKKTGDLLGTNYQRYMQNYLRSAADVDTSVEAVLKHLDETGRAKNTIIIYLSDQGFFLGEKGWYDKRWFYEPSAGTPFVMRLPNGMKRKVDTVTSNVDIAPTLLDLAGCKIPSDIQGKSLVPVINGAKFIQGRTGAYGHFYENNDGEHKVPKYVALATARTKIIYYYELNEWEMFDVKSDPEETKNLWDMPIAGRLRNEMVQKLLDEQVRLKEDPSVIEKVRQELNNPT